MRIDNVPRDYAWGSLHGIADLLGRPASGGPQAELWLGAHPGSPSFLVHPTGEEGTLAELIADEPAQTLGADWLAESSYDGAPRLGFLLKVLSAASPLSLQAHPSSEQAQAGFDRENELGIPLDSPDRNYKDPFHKPELIYALTPFDALCGFRDVSTSLAVLDRLIATGRAEVLPHDELDVLRAILHDAVSEESALRAAVGLLLGGGEGVEEMVAQATAIARTPKAEGMPELGIVRVIADAYPGDPGIVLALLLHRVALDPGQALYLPAGNIHAYLKGTGIELMAASDNVLRGGLTPKHIDVPELLRVLDFTPVPAPLLAPARLGSAQVFSPDVPDFRLLHVTADAELELRGPAIVLCTAGAASITGAEHTQELSRGEAVFVSPDEARLRMAPTDGGVLFVATGNR
ncbi:mannose-6-phosphate isomerase, class I [Humibacter ginsenosidimutans]|uniref:mannose-6-phosphate isomerase n=1 Tax=Humibacter ginsenosidimutans TaxID=2599293 RepID=A0A5B8M8F7_9MICO|nr:mannose-6-phosphate isomerase, class I [Humibacter ginsenosidimutans]